MGEIEELEQRKVELWQKAQAFIQEHFKLIGRVDEIQERIDKLKNGKETEETEGNGTIKEQRKP